MGDRTSVRLTVPTVYADQVAAILEDGPDGKPYEVQAHDDGTTEFSFAEINYGELQCLSDLQQAGIAYDSRWEAGDEYGPGKETCRFTEIGEIQVKEIYDDDDSIPLEELVKRIDDHEALKVLIQTWQEKLMVLPWENQAEYGKRHKLHRLL